MFGDRIRELRKKRNLTQEDIAKIFNVTYSAVSSWEVGKAQPNFEILSQLSKYFSVSTDYLLGIDKCNADDISKLKSVLKESGMMIGDDLTIEELEKALKIVEILKEQK